MNSWHGETAKGVGKSPEYCAWAQTKYRCFNPRCEVFQDYGGRGIKVCKRWMETKGRGFINFLKDLGRRPSPLHSLDRINNDGDYKPSNCRWATKSEQMYNKRKCRALENFSDAEIRTEYKRRGL